MPTGRPTQIADTRRPRRRRSRTTGSDLRRADSVDGAHAASVIDEGDVAADYIEEFLDICDLDGDIDIEARGGRAYISVDASGEQQPARAVEARHGNGPAGADPPRRADQDRRVLPSDPRHRRVAAAREAELGALVDRAVERIEEGAEAASLPPDVVLRAQARARHRRRARLRLGVRGRGPRPPHRHHARLSLDREHRCHGCGRCLEAEPAVAREHLRRPHRRRRAIHRRPRPHGEELGLIGPLELPRLWTRHVLNCALVAPLLRPGAVWRHRQRRRPARPGAGTARPDVDSHAHRADGATGRLAAARPSGSGLTNVEVIRARAEDVELDAWLDQVTARAVSRPAKLIPLTAPLVRDRRRAGPDEGRERRAGDRGGPQGDRRTHLVDVEVLVLGVGVSTRETTRVFELLEGRRRWPAPRKRLSAAGILHQTRRCSRSEWSSAIRHVSLGSRRVFYSMLRS